MMATFLRIGILAVTVIIPGGFLLLPLYLAYRAERRARALDFDGAHRRVPRTRQPPPRAAQVRRVLRRVARTDQPSLAARI